MKKKIVWLPYDFDTAIGINNEGSLVFGYELEDIDHLEGGADVFNGQESVVWKNLRDAFPDELAAMYKNLRSTGALSYAKVEKMFEDHQNKWPEAIFNEDSWFKYIDPLVNDGSGAYLPMLQGSKAEQRKWWLYNRFRYIDSKYNAGDALNDLIQIRGYAKSNVTVTPYADIYPTVKYGSYLISTRGKRGTATTLECPLDNVNDTEIYIYSASQLASVGDLSGFKVGFADFSMATKLQNIKIGDASNSYQNTNLNSLTLGNNVLLKTLDVRNCSALGTGSQKSVDISGCTNIEEVYFDGTSIQGVTLPIGGVIKRLHLPSTITNLTIRNQKLITDLVIGSYSNISTLRLENNGNSIDVKSVVESIPENTRVRLVGFYWEAQSVEEIADWVALLDKMRGLDENGNNVETAQVSGEIHIGYILGSQIAALTENYPYLRITADEVFSTLTFKSYDGTTTIKTLDCHNGVPDGEAPTVPSRPADAQYSYEAVGWSAVYDSQTADADAMIDVFGDRILYPAYKKTVKLYTATFVRAEEDGGGSLYVQVRIPYGTVPTYNGRTPTSTKGEPGEFVFKEWIPELAGITKDTTYTARFVSTASQTRLLLTRGITDAESETVTKVGSGTFKNCTTLVAINLPNITSVGAEAFYGCSSLTEINLLNVTSIEAQAFYGCSSLIEINLPKVTTIKSQGFKYFNFRNKSVQLIVPELLTIEDEGFYGIWWGFNTIDDTLFPKLISIGSRGFYNNHGLSSISLSKITTIKDWCFYASEHLTTIDFPNVTSVEANAFASSSRLANINLPEVTSLGAYAFQGCTSLTEISLPKVTSIGEAAFQSCKLSEINFSNLISIGQSAFQYSRLLTTVNLPEVTTISKWAFRQCSLLPEISLPKVTSIGEEAFQGCTSLTSINLPNITNIESGTFSGCTSLTEINLPEMTTIGHSAFSATSLAEISLPKVTSIGQQGFRGCTSLTKISLPSVTNVTGQAFQDCTSLTEVSLPNATTIGSNVFDNCTSLVSINLPKVTSISAEAFKNCTLLTTIILPVNQMVSIWNSTFYNNNNALNVYVPDNLVNLYKNNGNWSRLNIKGLSELPEQEA